MIQAIDQQSDGKDENMSEENEPIIEEKQTETDIDNTEVRNTRERRLSNILIPDMDGKDYLSLQLQQHLQKVRKYRLNETKFPP